MDTEVVPGAHTWDVWRQLVWVGLTSITGRSLTELLTGWPCSWAFLGHVLSRGGTAHVNADHYTLWWWTGQESNL